MQLGPAKTSLLENGQSSLKFPDSFGLYYNQRSLLQTTQADNTHYSPDLGQVSGAIEPPNTRVETIDQWQSLTIIQTLATIDRSH